LEEGDSHGISLDISRRGGTATEVAQSCTLLYRRFGICGSFDISERRDTARPADYKSAIQQIENLRYGTWRRMEVVPQLHEVDRW